MVLAGVTERASIRPGLGFEQAIRADLALSTQVARAAVQRLGSGRVRPSPAEVYVSDTSPPRAAVCTSEDRDGRDVGERFEPRKYAFTTTESLTPSASIAPDRQIEVKGRRLPRPVVEREHAAVLGDDSMADREPQTGALIASLGRKEGIEDPPNPVGRHAATIVGHL